MKDLNKIIMYRILSKIQIIYENLGKKIAYIVTML